MSVKAASPRLDLKEVPGGARWSFSYSWRDARIGPSAIVGHPCLPKHQARLLVYDTP